MLGRFLKRDFVKSYWFSFSNFNADPRPQAGLSPSFILFFNQLGQTQAPPGITEIFSGSGMYRFQYDIGYSTTIRYLVQAGNSNFLQGALDPVGALDVTIGWTGSAFGSTSTDPSDVFGMLKRNQENFEGNATFLKSSGVWNIFSRGSSTLLSVKTITQNTTGVTKI